MVVVRRQPQSHPDLPRLRTQRPPCGVSDVKDYDLLPFDNEENPVALVTAAVEELPDLTLENIAFRSAGAAFRKLLEGQDRADKAIPPAHGGFR